MSGRATTAREMSKRLQLYALCRRVAATMEGSHKGQGLKTGRV
ncbi:MAG: hypothetical protein WAQ41_03200 [bacterium]|nr:hypothetical protein [Bacillota bacterium]